LIDLFPTQKPFLGEFPLYPVAWQLEASSGNGHLTAKHGNESPWIKGLAGGVSPVGYRPGAMQLSHIVRFTLMQVSSDFLFDFFSDHFP
jgi:hypothetical protein